ncbi:MAG TPA: MotA/TolQ/ExbB proton channel family protein [Gammaproteobacteria bacterium]|nr:MotA/TolQ/ExbB proton channel family protein [Gammaproteobacteria bacterium]|tara:strand:+ start:2334 stop:3131 length:798 start_codon:yes stop_codon:yes gene_type:complete
MRHSPFFEFYFQIIALMVSIIVVHAFYITVVRPNAQTEYLEQLELQSAGEVTEISRSGYAVIKDYEQEACFILAFWATAIIGFKARQGMQERQYLKRSLLDVEDGTRILPEDTRKFSRAIQALPLSEREYLVPRSLLAALQRFGSTHSIQDVATTVKDVCETQADRLDSELAMIRYIIWAIPSIGFIGTVRGIGQALGQAHRAVEGDIVGVTTSLGVAFNSTFIALVISLFIMFLMHQLQLLQERLVLDTQSYVDVNLLRQLALR